jgi:hypothetical protein
MTTAVPSPSFTDKGFIAPDEAAVLAGVQSDINTAFGGGLDPGLSTPQGQLASSGTAIIGDKDATFLHFTNQVDPALNSGRMQDAIGRIYFITRKPALPTVVELVCSGLNGVVIPVGALGPQDADGNLYVCTQQGTIAGGSVTLSFSNTQTGPIPCSAGAINGAPYQAIFGWDSATNPADGVLGSVVESRAAFETRRAQSTAANSIGSLPSILGAVLNVAGVLDAYVIANATASPVTIGGVTLPANALYVAAVGGAAADVAFAIWTRKPPGGPYYAGNTTITVTDPSPSYSPPAPTYSVVFEIPPAVSFFVLVTITNDAAVPSNALTLIQNAVIAAFAGADGGSRARIGSIVYAARFYGPVAALGTWAQRIVSIQLGTGTAASFTGSITAATLTVSAVASGALAAGQLLQDAAGHISQGTTIVAQLTGSPGSTGTYSVSVVQSPAVASEAMTSVAMVNDVKMNINQVPAIAASGINLALV